MSFEHLIHTTSCVVHFRGSRWRKASGSLTEMQMARRAKLRGLLALVSKTNDRKKRIEFLD